MGTPVCVCGGVSACVCVCVCYLRAAATQLPWRRGGERGRSELMKLSEACRSTAEGRPYRAANGEAAFVISGA